MKIKVISDLHTNHYRNKPRQDLLQKVAKTDCDVLVICGDLTSNHQCISRDLKFLCDNFNNVVYVLGNHDYWGYTVEEIQEHLRKLDSKVDNLHFLEKSITNISGQRFIGATMWYSFENFAPYVNGWCDHQYICDHLSPTKTYHRLIREHEETRLFFEKEMKPKDIVVTHHLPSYNLISDRFYGDLCNCFFAVNMDELMRNKKPNFWFHGHSHDFMHTSLYGVETVRNPIGYPGEMLCSYNNSFIIDTSL